MEKDSEKLKKVTRFSERDVNALKSLFKELEETISEDKDISEQSINFMDRLILELLQMKKRHVTVYMSLLRQGFKE